MQPAVRLWAAAVVASVLLTGCSGTAPPTPPGHDVVTASPSGSTSAPPVSRAQLATTPADGAQDVAADGPVKVTVSQGRLASVRLADDRGAAVPGTIAADGTGWTPGTRLALATRYTLDAVAEDPAGLRAAQHVQFATVSPEHAFAAFLTPDDGSTVGVGMPVSVRFSRPIADRAAVERAVAVTADPPVPVVGHWFGDQRVDFRPEKYWAAGTRVTVALRLKDVEGAPGYFGTQSKELRFTVGRAQVSTADLEAHTLTVRQDGRVLRTLRMTAGSPEHSTYLGTMVVSEKYEVTRMNSQTVGMGDEYDIKDVPHAMRLTTSGTFVHGNYWSDRGVFGTANTSHGCLSLADAKGGSDDSPAGWFYAHSLVGDVIEVQGGGHDRVPPENGLNGWNLSWSQWARGSALAGR